MDSFSGAASLPRRFLFEIALIQDFTGFTAPREICLVPIWIVFTREVSKGMNSARPGPEAIAD
jgi:hypothetical protein